MTVFPTSLVEALIAHAAQQPDKPAVHFLLDGEAQRLTLTYAQLDRQARDLAAELSRHAGVGERALLLMQSGPGYVVSFYACLYAGIIAVPALPPESLRQYELSRVRAILDDAQPSLVLTEAHLCESLLQAFDQALPTTLSVDTLALEGSHGWQVRYPANDDIAFLQYTSGSTATPKGVEVSHGNLVANERMMVSCFDLHPGDTFVSWLPLYHDMGLIGCLLLSLYRGATLVLMSPRHFVERPARWLEAISQYRATHTGAPDFAFRLAAERVNEKVLATLDLSCLRVLFSGSEPVRQDSLDAFARHFAVTGFDPLAFLPCYGLAEATLFVTGTTADEPFVSTCFDSHALGEDRAEPGEGSVLVSSGILHPGLEVMLVDPHTGDIQPDSRIGEIWTSGDSVARGYWRNRQASARAFVCREGRTWLRTGDLGFLREGRLFVTGRLKDMIIVRGQNIYPQDLERAVEYNVEGARKGRVSAFVVEQPQGEGIGIAVEIGRTTQRKISAAQVCAEIDRVVADVCQQTPVWIALLNPGELPKTSSGKLQRSACRQMLERAELDCFHMRRNDRPVVRQGRWLASDHERAVAAVWAEVLGQDEVFADDSFFALGGNSIAAAQIVGRLREQLGVDLTLASVFDNPGLADFAERVAEAAGGDARPVLAAAVSDELVPSYAQERMWFAWQLDPQSSVYNVPLALHLRGPLDVEALRAAFAALQQRHEVLRTTFTPQGEGARLVRHAALRVDFAVEDLLGLLPSQRLDQARQRAAAQARQPFDLSSGPMQRVHLLRLDEREHVLLLTTHHIAVDGWSMRNLVDELEVLYTAQLTGIEPVLPALVVGYGDFARWQRALLAGPEHARQLDYWRQALAGEQSWQELHGQRPRHKGALAVCEQFAFSGVQTSALRSFATARGVTPFMLLLGAFAITLREHSGQSRIRLGSDIANRSHPAAEPLVGFFINQLVLQVDLDLAASSDALLEQCRRVVLGAAQHQDLPFEQLVEALRPPRRAGRSPFFSIKLNYQEGEPPLPRLCDVRVEPFEASQQAAELDLILGFYSSASRLEARFEMPEGLFEPGEIAQLFAQIQAVLDRWLAKPGQTQADLLEAAAQLRREARAIDSQQRQSLLGSQRPLRRRAAQPSTSQPHSVQEQ
ncbi:AMP-binding protein [Pseudomonas sp. GD03860]|uniref:condensation domain-containing protein n=1 Tax=Pseudomonas TaxID=286 RepID=UPI00236488C0|nr:MULTISPECIES: condensation domain-containing protein [Pseudomonas]MDD2058576.1 AMP-binding protein [Pseudomonas putida]MDH0639559.1 AMP-binding protein [Pseudomonas sp. GD03860]